MTQMTNQETDTALILEGELKRRVADVMGQIVHKVVRREMETHFAEQKANMLMEISIAVGKMMRVMEEEGRKPLWEATPAEFGLTHEDLNTHNIGNPNAIRE
jgi:hypothetical protein